MKTFLISDTHFGHANMLNFKDSSGFNLRVFDDVDHMNETMVYNWNKTVSQEDKVYHLGDVGFKSFSALKSIMDRLNGKKILIKGNHDNLKLSQYAQMFSDVRAYHVLDGMVLSHIPIHPDSLNRWKANIHGHLHNNVLEDIRYFNVSVERINYTPIDFEKIRSMFN